MKSYFLIALFGTLLFLGIAFTFGFKDTKLQTLFPKKSLFAASSDVSFFSDIDKNGYVNIFDYNQLVTDFDKSVSTASDILPSGKVDIFDYNQLVTDFDAHPVFSLIYDEALGSGWQDWSAPGVIHNFSDTSKPYSNIKNASARFTVPWETFTFHHNGFNTSPYDTLTFAVQATQPGQKIALILDDVNGSLVKTSLDNFGGEPPVGSYRVYSIPLASVNATGKTITDITLHEFTGAAQPAIYVDTVAFVKTNIGGPSLPPPTPTSTLTPTPGSIQKFTTIPPNPQDPVAVLPTDADCATRVRARGAGFEPRAVNFTYNNYVPSSTEIQTYRNNYSWGTAVDTRAIPLYNRVTGNFTGTTDQIIAWASCKWGFDEDIIRGVAVKESYWNQEALGDYEAGKTCAVGFPPGADGKCPQSFGLTQIRGPVLPHFPLSRKSTAFNVDYKGAWQRACFEGYVGWLNDVTHNTESNLTQFPGTKNPYQLGDEWGCVGMWFSGRWWADGTLRYLWNDPSGFADSVKRHRDEKTWTKAGF